MIKLACKLKAGGFLDQGFEIVVAGGGVHWYRGMEKPTLADIDSAKELPIAVEFWVHRPVGAAFWEALETFMQFLGAKDGQHHLLIKVRAFTLNADGVPHHRMGAITTD